MTGAACLAVAVLTAVLYVSGTRTGFLRPAGVPALVLWAGSVEFFVLGVHFL